MRPHPALPVTASVTEDGMLLLGGCAVTALAQQFGTPLYVYDVATLRAAMRDCREALGEAGAAHYACKAYLARWLMDLVRDEGLGLDVCSGVEMQLALASGFPAGRIRLHGNNKPVEALRLAVRSGIGAVVVDSIPELRMLIGVAAEERRQVRVLLRLNPGIVAHTHRYLQTGALDSKFGIGIKGGEAVDAVALALEQRDWIVLLGYHAHIGTQIFILKPYRLLIRSLISFATGIQSDYGFWPAQLSPGGGVGITYTNEAPPSLRKWLGTMRAEMNLIAPARRPQLGVEPGRAIAGPAGVAIYRVGTIKRVAGGRTYISVDGGMADNIRPALYQAQYTALAATRMRQPATQTATIAGPYCESGDILVRDADLPELERGDLIALPASGAYCLPMSSNYNGALRPAVVAVEGGAARLVQRRQTVDDLWRFDQPMPPGT